ncbi:vgr related protein [Alterisphingorhabdus coralli]|uniref:Vgr related protein n=1 Tax=Alterisphingorhabdus coralli TaxID=3071408 RepID=A0AA97HZ31_9SPHN|nr:vgr related protein [Parasphingorhabdus sp. SCSIO 66989]WOE74149.1 vgr related protein [Parasphingorhabdus sp. SCSIO 66989]
MTSGEIALVQSVFGDAIDLAPVQLCHSKWFWFQPRKTVMAPLGHIHFHPHSPYWSEDFSQERIGLRGLFIHEMVHVWQHQQGIFLPLKRLPFARYGYSLKPGWTLERYGIEQQAEIVRHVYLLREGATLPGAPSLEQYEGVLPFTPIASRIA